MPCIFAHSVLSSPLLSRAIFYLTCPRALTCFPRYPLPSRTLVLTTSKLFPQMLHDCLNKRTDGDVGEALVSFLIWMSKYDRLFQDPCKIANKLVATDSGTGEPLPPTLRSSDGTPLLAESLAGTPQREPQKPASPLAAAASAAAAAAAGAATAEA